MRVFSIVGARPQFIKVAVICRAVAEGGLDDEVDHSIVHTGQHYDPEMSDVFFRELEIPRPSFHLEVGSGAHGEQTGEMMKRLEPIVAAQRPDWLLLYGDTNSTLAGALVGAKLGVPVAHVEAGLRSYNRRMPEEINRIVADHLSNILFCPTATAMRNLASEGLSNRAVLSGDVMYDAALYYRALAESRGGPLSDRWTSKSFALATVHRAESTDDPDKLRAIFAALEQISAECCPVLLPLHPRTRKRLSEASIEVKKVTLIPPVSYLEMLLIESRARFILTDSGGVQKEAYFVRVPCITMRNETEWVETLERGCNVLAGTDTQAILRAVGDAGNAGHWTESYGTGQAGKAILDSLLRGQQLPG